MAFSFRAAAVWVPGYFQLGHWHLPVFGLFAAAGLVLALLASQRTAQLAGVPPTMLWDAGMFAVLAAFVASRLLLVLGDPTSFRRYPLLVLSLPSLTYGGLLLTAVLVWLWLRWKKLPVLDAADAWAPCGALLWAVLSLGHFVEGTDAGLPTSVMWGTRTQGDTVLGHVQPVQLYAMAFALLLAFLLWVKLPGRKQAGDIAALGLVAGGAGAFLLDMLRQPVDTYGDSLLDPAQWVAAGAMLAGAALLVPYHAMFRSRRTPNRAEVANFLEDFVRERGRNGVDTLQRLVTKPRFTDPLLVEVQDRVFHLPADYPPESERFPWCGERGLELLRWYTVQLRSSEATATRTTTPSERRVDAK